jgi:hypothetical protein
MDEPATPDDPSAIDPPAVEAPRPRPRWVLRGALMGLAVVAAGVGAAFFVLRDDDRSYPDAWDPRVQPYVDIVEKQRELSFDHPVTVRFLKAAAFEKSVRADKTDLDADDRKDLAESTSLLRALGLLAGDVDLFDAVNNATGAGTLAYYSFEDEAITVRGSRLTVANRATVVHELTHALQDQKFDIGKRLETLRKKAADGAATTQADALDAIVEGDAERVATLYRDSLDEDDRAALDAAEETDTAGALAGLEKVPKVVQTLLSAPYALGEALTQTVASEGTEKLDALFADPPPDDSVLLDPLRALEPLRTERVDVPSPRAGETSFDTGQIGSLLTYLMLAERIPLDDALAAADAWSGDAYVGFERQGVLCVRVDYAVSTSADRSRLDEAFTEWIGAVDRTRATVTSTGRTVTFESCDPGTNATLANDASEQALQLVATRAYIGAGTVDGGAPARFARCYADRVVAEFTIEQLSDPAFGEDDPAVTQRFESLAEACS